MHKRSCFITLTYSDEKLPEDFSVSLREWQLFAKRLRKKLVTKFATSPSANMATNPSALTITPSSSAMTSMPIDNYTG